RPGLSPRGRPRPFRRGDGRPLGRLRRPETPRAARFRGPASRALLRRSPAARPPGGPARPPGLEGAGGYLSCAPARDRTPRLRGPAAPGRPAGLEEGVEHRPRPGWRGVRPVTEPDSESEPRRPAPPHVVIVGGGLAGLAAAVALVGRGLRITLL